VFFWWFSFFLFGFFRVFLGLVVGFFFGFFSFFVCFFFFFWWCFFGGVGWGLFLVGFFWFKVPNFPQNRSIVNFPIPRTNQDGLSDGIHVSSSLLSAPVIFTPGLRPPPCFDRSTSRPAPTATFTSRRSFFSTYLILRLLPVRVFKLLASLCVRRAGKAFPSVSHCPPDPPKRTVNSLFRLFPFLFERNYSEFIRSCGVVLNCSP